MKIKVITTHGVRHVVIKDPTFSGVILLPIEDGASPYAKPGNKWSFDGNLENPTLTPSIACRQDHFFVRNGMVEFCGDAPHANAGKTVPLPDLGDLADIFEETT